MSIADMFQALFEPDLCDSLGVGVADLVERFAVLANVSACLDPAAGRGDLASKGPGNFQVHPRASPEREGNGDLIQLIRLLCQEIQSSFAATNSDPVLLIGRDGSVRAFNTPAKRLLQEQQVLELKEARAHFIDPDTHRGFLRNNEAFFRRPADRRVLINPHVLLVYRPVMVRMVPMAAISIRLTQVAIDVSVEELQSVLQVSPKQALIAKAVMRGLGPLEFAKESGCTRKSARFHLYKLMGRLNCHTQTELTNKLVRMFD